MYLYVNYTKPSLRSIVRRCVRAKTVSEIHLCMLVCIHVRVP